MNFENHLIEHGYKKVDLKQNNTNHFEVIASINGVEGLFILDTGASNSCVSFISASVFSLTVTDSQIKASSFGVNGMETNISKDNSLKIGEWELENTDFVLFDLSHVNQALINHVSNPVDGVIGSEILKKGKAIIDYHKKYLYLKK